MADTNNMTGWELAEQLLKDKPQTAESELRSDWPYSLGYPASPVGVIYELILVDGTRAEVWVDLSHQYEAGGPDWRRAETGEVISETVVVAWRKKPEGVQAESQPENSVEVERDAKGNAVRIGSLEVVCGPCETIKEARAQAEKKGTTWVIRTKRPFFYHEIELDGKFYCVESPKPGQSL